MRGAKETVALTSVIASAALAALKLTVGMMTGSLAILAEGMHALLDLGATALTLLAVRIADAPADDRHQYGHGKIESVSALIEAGLLFLTALWIVKEAVQRLMAPTQPLAVNGIGIAAIVVSILIDGSRAHALKKISRSTKSLALEADAIHFSTDVVSSCVVLVGLGLVALGLPRADAMAAIGVAGFVAVAAWRLARRTIDVLMDAAPDGIVTAVTAFLSAVPDVVRVDSVRARPAGTTVFVEAQVGVNRSLAQEQVHALRLTLQERLKAVFPEITPLLIAEPLALDDEAISETVRIIAARLGMQIHDVGVVDMAGQRHVGFDLEVGDSLTLKEAHDLASLLEERIAQGLGPDLGIDIHIDPRRTRMTTGVPVSGAMRAHVEQVIVRLARQSPLIKGLHGLFLQSGPDGLYVSFHCVFANDARVKTSHDVSVFLEHEIASAIPAVGRVVVHAEPEDHCDAPITDRDGPSFAAFAQVPGVIR